MVRVENRCNAELVCIFSLCPHEVKHFSHYCEHRGGEIAYKDCFAPQVEPVVNTYLKTDHHTNISSKGLQAAWRIAEIPVAEGPLRESIDNWIFGGKCKLQQPLAFEGAPARFETCECTGHVMLDWDDQTSLGFFLHLLWR